MHRAHAVVGEGNTQQCLSRFNVCQNPENIQLIWCDACCAETIDEIINDDVQYAKGMLNGLNVQTEFFGNVNQCIENIKSKENNCRIILIVSGSFASNILSTIHSYRSVSFIFIFCEYNEKYLPLLSEYNKIVDIYTKHEQLRSALCQKLNLLEKKTFQFTVFNQQQKSIRNLAERTMDSLIFVVHSILFNILIRMPSDDHAKEHLIDTCRSFLCESKYDLIMIERFQTTFKPEDAIKWYTNNCFLFRLLNRALRTETSELLFAFRFFIIVLCDALKREKEKLPPSTVYTLFRGQKMTVDEFNRLREMIGGYITTNGFLSTSADIDVALMFAGYGAECPETLCIVLFEIKATSDVKSIVFAPIEGESNFVDEKEVLFSLNAVFKIETIDFDEQYQVWKVRMVATDEGSRYVDRFLQAAMTTGEKKSYSPLMFYGYALWSEFYQVDKGKVYFLNLVKTLPKNHSDFPIIYFELGCICHKQEKWFEALEYLVCSRDLLCIAHQEKSEQMARVWHVMGKVYCDKGEPDESLECLQRALSIWDPNVEHIEKARTLEHIGKAYERKNSIDYYDKVLDYYNQALDMYQRLLPIGHDNIINCLQRIGHFYDMTGQFDLGIASYKRTASSALYSICEDPNEFIGGLNQLIEQLKRRINKFGPENTLQSTFLLLNGMMTFRINTLNEDENAPIIAIIIGMMGDLCEESQSLAKIAYYELAICKLESNSESYVLSMLILGYVDKLYFVYMDVKEYKNVMKCLEKRLDIQQKHLSPESIDIVTTRFRMGNIHQHMRSHPFDSIPCFIQALNLYESIERPDNTLFMKKNFNQMIALEMRRLNS